MFKETSSNIWLYVLVPKKPKNHAEINQTSKLKQKENRKWAVEEEDLEEDGEVQDKVSVDQPPVDVHNVDTQLHILAEHHAPVWPAPSVVQD